MYAFFLIQNYIKTHKVQPGLVLLLVSCFFHPYWVFTTYFGCGGIYYM